MKSSRLGWRYYSEIKGIDILWARATCVCCVIKHAMTTGLLLCFRNFMGEDLDSLNLRGLQSLEQQLDSALKHIRSRKVKLHVQPRVFW